MERNISLRIGNNTTRKTIIVPSTMTPIAILAKEQICITNGKLHLNGYPISATEANSPIGDLLPNLDSADLMVVIKTDNARN